MKTRLAVLSCVAIVILTACVAPGVAANPPQGKALAVQLSPRNSNIVLAPPGTSSAKVTSTDAYRLCSTGVADCDPSTPTEIDLALATDPDFGPANAAGTVSPRLKNTVVWAVMWRGIVCPSGGGGKTLATQQPTPAASAAASLCDKFALIDATTGEFVYSYLYPHE